MMKAIWNGVVVAESAEAFEFDGYPYFPADSVQRSYLRPSETHSVCSWKGMASYYTLEVDGKRNADAAWYYPDPSSSAGKIVGYIGFWKGVQISE